jgi:hypothetical protein
VLFAAVSVGLEENPLGLIILLIMQLYGRTESMDRGRGKKVIEGRMTYGIRE